MLFFVSVGMLFDPSILIREPWMVVGVVSVILVGKTLAAMGIVWLLGFPLSTALTVSASLSQIGEFSFILGGLGVSYGLMAGEGLNLILAGALVSITMNPVVFMASDRICSWVRSRPNLKRKYEDCRHARYDALKKELEETKIKAAKKAAEHKTFTPEELAERFPLFRGMTEEQREVLVYHFEPHSAEPGQRVIRAGEEADKVYFIASGEVEVTVAKQRIRLSAGDYFGEMALINKKPRSADVTATNYSKFATLSRRDFNEFLRRFPSIREQIAAQAAHRVEKNQQFVDEFALTTPSES